MVVTFLYLKMFRRQNFYVVDLLINLIPLRYPCWSYLAGIFYLRDQTWNINQGFYNIIIKDRPMWNIPCWVTIYRTGLPYLPYRPRETWNHKSHVDKFNNGYFLNENFIFNPDMLQIIKIEAFKKNLHQQKV